MLTRVEQRSTTLTKTLVLGASRSGTAALQQAISTVTGLLPTVMAAQLGFLDCAAHALKSHANAVAAATPCGVSNSSFESILIQFWKALLHEQQGSGQDGVLISAPEILSNCPNFKAARTLMALDPEWRAIAIQRHPVDFVNSRLRAFPENDFATHCLLWTNAAHQLQKLKETLGSRVLVLSHANLLRAPDEVGAIIARFLRLDEDAGQVIARSLSETRPGRSATFLHDRVLRLSDTSWSAPEISLFQFLCEEQAAALGYTLDMEGVTQSRPVDLVRVVAEECRVSGNWVAYTLEDSTAQPRIQCGDHSSGAGALHIGPISAGGRRRLRLRLLSEITDGKAELRFDVVQSLSRRPVFGRTFALVHNDELSVDTMLPAHDGLLDLVFSGREAGAPFELLVCHASLSHA